MRYRDSSLFCGILILAFLLRWPFPEFTWQHVDERVFIETPLGFFSGDLNPHFFYYPTLQLYLTAICYLAYYLLSPETTLESFAAYHYFINQEDILPIARGLTTVMAVGAVAVAMRIAQRLYGSPAGLVAGLVLAFMPLHARYSHLAATDIPAAFWSGLALLWAVRIAQGDQRRGTVLAAALWVGLAASTKYPAALSALPVLFAMHRENRRAIPVFCVTALGAFAASSPFVLLDFPTFWADLGEMAGKHALSTTHSASTPTVWHVLSVNLRYGLGGAALLCLPAAILWRGRLLRGEEAVVVCALVVSFAFAGLSKSAFMRYAVPMAIPAAVLLTRAFALWPNRRWLGLLFILPMAEPAYSTLQTRLWLAGPDTRTQAREWLEDNAPAGYLMQHPPGGGNLKVLSTVTVKAFKPAYIKRHGEDGFARACSTLGLRNDLPPIYGWIDQPFLAFAASKDRETGKRAVVCYFEHPLSAAAPLADGINQRISWQETFSPGNLQEAAFDPTDWYFLPIGGWGGTRATGPKIRIGSVPIADLPPAPTTASVFGLHYRSTRLFIAEKQEDWQAVRALAQAILASPYILDVVFAGDELYRIYVAKGKAHRALGEKDQARSAWEIAARAYPQRVEARHLLRSL